MEVPVARTDLPAGRAIHASDIRRLELSHDELRERGWRLDKLVTPLEFVIDRTPKRSIMRGQPFYAEDLYLVGTEPESRPKVVVQTATPEPLARQTPTRPPTPRTRSVPPKQAPASSAVEPALDTSGDAFDEIFAKEIVEREGKKKTASEETDAGGSAESLVADPDSVVAMYADNADELRELPADADSFGLYYPEESEIDFDALGPRDDSGYAGVADDNQRALPFVPPIPASTLPPGTSGFFTLNEGPAAPAEPVDEIPEAYPPPSTFRLGSTYRHADGHNPFDAMTSGVDTGDTAVPLTTIGPGEFQDHGNDLFGAPFSDADRDDASAIPGENSTMESAPNEVLP